MVIFNSLFNYLKFGTVNGLWLKWIHFFFECQCLKAISELTGQFIQCRSGSANMTIVTVTMPRC